MGGAVVEKLCDGGNGSFDAFGLSRSKGSESNKHGWIDSSAIVEKGTDNCLKAGETIGAERSCGEVS
jgi:hypothetical protein